MSILNAPILVLLAATDPAAPGLPVDVVVELLLIASAVALVANRLRVPYTVALTAVGFGVGLLHLLPAVQLSKDVIFLVFLPPLLFEGSLAMDLGTLRARWAEVLLLALPATLFTVAAIAWPVHWIFGLDLTYCLLLGAILAPTDPVSVIALFKEARVSRELAVIVEGESSFNDGVGVVLYLIFLGALEGGAISALPAARLFGTAVLGGAAVGSALGYATYRLLRHIDDHLIEVMISLVLAYASYLLAERVGVSGVISVVAAGLIMGNYGKMLAMSPTTRVALSHFWEVMAFVANSLVFLLMGMAIEHANILGAAARIGAAYAILLASRFAIVHLLGGVLALAGRPMPRSWRHLIAWSGLRGALCVALAIGLPSAFAGGDDGSIPGRDETVALVSGVVLASMVIQGLSIMPLLRRLGLDRRDEAEESFERETARELTLVAAAQELERLREAGRIPAPLIARFEAVLAHRREEVRGRLTALVAGHAALARSLDDNVARTLALAARAAVEDALRRGEIAEDAAERAIRELEGWLEGDPP